MKVNVLLPMAAVSLSCSACDTYSDLCSGPDSASSSRFAKTSRYHYPLQVRLVQLPVSRYTPPSMV